MENFIPKSVLCLLTVALNLGASPTRDASLELEFIDRVISPPGEFKGLRPAILLVHGGGWSQGNSELLLETAEVLAEKGYLAALARYHLADGGGDGLLPGLADVRAAYRELLSYHDKLALDPDRIYILGESAGGHLAAASILLADLDAGVLLGPDESHPPAGLILVNPVLDLTVTPWLKGHNSLPEPSRLDLDNIDQVREILSPQFYEVDRLPRVMILHGEADKVVSPEQARAFCEKLKKHGKSFKLIVFPSVGHAFLIPGYGNWEIRDRAHQSILDWLAEDIENF